MPKLFKKFKIPPLRPTKPLNPSTKHLTMHTQLTFIAKCHKLPHKKPLNSNNNSLQIEKIRISMNTF
jgi:hypothetical protein